jgi:spore germination protein KB
MYLVFAQLIKIYPQKTLIGICRQAFGKWFGNVLAVVYVFAFIFLASYNLCDFEYFVALTMLPNTPSILASTIFILTCALAVKSGAQIVCRYSLLFTMLSLLILFMATILSLPLWKLENFLPALKLPVIRYVQGVHIVAMIPFAETISFMMFAPAITGDKTKLGRYFILGSLLGVVNLFLVVARNIAVLGNSMNFFTLPPYEVFKLIHLSNTFSRTEILYASVFIMLYFFKISIHFYAASLAFAETFGLKSYRPIVYLIGTLIIVFSLNVYQSNIDHAESAVRFTPFVWLFPEILIPISLLVAGKLKNKKKKSVRAQPPSGQDNVANMPTGINQKEVPS